MPLKINNNSLTFFESINQENTFSWTSMRFKNNNDKSKMNVIKEGYITQLDDNSYDTIQYLTDAIVGDDDITVNPFYFLSLTIIDNFKIIESGIAFAMKFTDLKYSITHQLYNNHIISKLSYAIVPETKDDGHLFYGSIPNKYTDNKQSFTCKSDPLYTTWGCKLSHVFIGDISYIYENVYYKNTARMLFQASEEMILVSDDFMLFIEKHLFAQKLKQKICEKNSELNIIFLCKCDQIKNFKPIKFIFEGVAIEVNTFELFKEFREKCQFLITNNYRNTEGNLWKFGTAFLGLMITEYDYEKQSITFYSNNTITNLNMNTLFPKSRIWKVIEVLIFIGLGGILIVISYRRCKKRKEISMKNTMDDVYKQINAL